MKTSLLSILALGAALFFAGVAIGQKKQSELAQFDKRTRIVTDMDWRLLQANLHLIRNKIGTDKDGIGVPEVLYDMKRQKVVAYVDVDADALEKLPMDRLSGLLTYNALRTLSWANVYLRTKPGVDTVDFQSFEAVFEGFAGERMSRSLLAGQKLDMEAYEFYAEYKNGELTVRAKTPGLK